MMNEVRFSEVLCPARLRPSISLTLGRRKEVKPETTQSSLPIFESATTGIALMTFELSAAQFSSTISVSAANQFSLPKCGVNSESVFVVEV
jgi:hypothetical protein